MKLSFYWCLPFFIVFACAASAQRPFITTWKTDNPGSSCDRCIEIPVFENGYDYQIDWGDGAGYDTIRHTGTASHEYDIPGVYDIRIIGDFPRIVFSEDVRDTFSSCLLYTSPSPRDQRGSRMPSSA